MQDLILYHSPVHNCDVMMHDIKNFIFAKLRDLIA